MKRIPQVLFMVGLLSACVAPSPMQVSGGSKANGEVVLSYDYNVMQQPNVNVQQWLGTAAGRCQGWGYAGAVPNGSPDTTCSNRTQDGDCIAWKVTARFQCTGGAQ